MKKRIIENMPLVKSIARGMSKNMSPNVLYDDLVGAGMLGLVDADLKYRWRMGTFVNYARIRIRGAIIDGLRSSDWSSRKIKGDTSYIEDLSLVPEDRVRVGIEGAIHRKRLAETLINSCKQLKPRYQAVIRLYYSRGMRFCEIARFLGVSTVRVHQIHKIAIGKIKEILDKN